MGQRPAKPSPEPEPKRWGRCGPRRAMDMAAYAVLTCLYISPGFMPKTHLPILVSGKWRQSGHLEVVESFPGRNM